MISGLVHMLSLDFIRHALLAGTSIALLSGLVGYFVVVRAQVFAGDALSHVSYTAALAALAAGVDLRIGLFAGTALVAVLLGVLGGRAAADDVVIGTVFSWILGLGVLFLTLYTTHTSGGNGTANVKVLFGSLFGISASAAATATWIALLAVAALCVLARPLLFASVDRATAAGYGVRVRMLDVAFLVVLGVAAAEASQAIGALLLLGLLGAPAATARLLTDRPWRAFVLSGVLAVAAVWVGIVVAYAAPKVPVSFAIMAATTCGYAAAAAGSWLRRRTRDQDSLPMPAAT
jgi:zinc/manganese transport system permease protein